jgi:hypothetical protein
MFQIMSDAERTRRYRTRKAAGVVMMTIAIESTAVGEFLVDRGFLEQWDVDDLSAVRAALEQAIEVWSSQP